MKRSLAWNNKGNATANWVIFLRSDGQRVTDILAGGFRGEIVELVTRREGTVRRTARRGSF